VSGFAPNRDHHARQFNPFIRTITLGDFAKRIAWYDCVSGRPSAGNLARRRIQLVRCRCVITRRPAEARRRRSIAGSGLRPRGLGPYERRLRQDALLIHQHRWIQQYRVLAHQPAVGPAQIDEKIKKRFAHRFPGRHLNDCAVIAGGHDVELQLRQRERALNTNPLENLLRSERGLHVFNIVWFYRKHADVGTQRLVERGADRDVPESRTPCGAGRENR